MGYFINKNLKGFIFSLDALFALIVASLGITIMLYMYFSFPQAFQTQATNSQSMLQNMLHTNIGDALRMGAISEAYQRPVVNPENISFFGNEGIVSTNSSVLSAITELYANGIGGYASLLLNSIYNSTDVGIIINNQYAPSLFLAQFNQSKNSHITTNMVNLPIQSAKGSVFAWVYPSAYPTGSSVIESYGSSAGTAEARAISINSAGKLCFNGTSDNACSNFALPLDNWSFVGYTYASGTNITIYYDNASETLPLSSALNTLTNIGCIGSWIVNNGCSTDNWNGTITDVQIYNKVLTSNQIAYLYQENFGGVPVNEKDIVSWWALEGNANDYTVSNNSGTASEIKYVNSTYFPGSFSNAFIISKASMPMAISINGNLSIKNISVVIWR
jgi:hypothetical protein